MLRAIPADWPERPTTRARGAMAANHVVIDLEHGQLDSLAEHIRACRGQIHEQVALALFDLLCGPKERIGYRLECCQHPDRSSNERLVADLDATLVRTARIMAAYRSIAAKQGRKEALHQVATRFDISERDVERAITAYKKYENVRALTQWLGEPDKP
jgi:hypothetical protein